VEELLAIELVGTHPSGHHTRRSHNLVEGRDGRLGT
jgi:hypothetical protein